MQKKKYNIKTIEFLNAPVDEIYYRKKHYITGVDLLNFKGQMSSYFVQMKISFSIFHNRFLRQKKINLNFQNYA